MRLVIQRVLYTKVDVGKETVAHIGPGFLILLGITHSDTGEEIPYLAKKVAELRVFADEQGKMNRSILDIGGEVVVVSQFTLYADCSRGRRPDFMQAAATGMAEPMYLRFSEELRSLGIPVQTGHFGAHMEISLRNDGPVTIILERP